MSKYSVLDLPAHRNQSKKAIQSTKILLPEVRAQELATIQQKILSKQPPTTLEKARKQVQTLKKKLTKEQETEKLTAWITDNNFWFTGHDENRFIAREVKQKIYLYTDEKLVYKLNDSIFYE